MRRKMVTTKRSFRQKGKGSMVLARKTSVTVEERVKGENLNEQKEKTRSEGVLKLRVLYE